MALGDVYLLVENFAKTENFEKRILLQSFLDNSHKGAKNTAKNTEVRKRKKWDHLTVSFCWHHYDQEKKRYTQVRHGGGKRTKVIDKDATISSLQDAAIMLFFPNGLSTKGKITKFDVNLAAINEVELKDVFGEGAFSISNYCEQFGLKSAKFILLSKQKKLIDMVKIGKY